MTARLPAPASVASRARAHHGRTPRPATPGKGNDTMKQLLILAVAGLALAGCSAAERPAAKADGAIAIAVTEKGFEPAEVTVRKGEPVTLVVTRKTDRTCATEFVMKDAKIDQPLPLGQAVTISFTPGEEGEMRFACSMDMVAGRVVVR